MQEALDLAERLEDDKAFGLILLDQGIYINKTAELAEHLARQLREIPSLIPLFEAALSKVRLVN